MIGIGPQGARAELYNLNVCYASFPIGPTLFLDTYIAICLV